MNKRSIALTLCVMLFGGGFGFGQGIISGNHIRTVKPASETANFNEAYRLQEAAQVALEAGQYATAELDARQSMSLSLLDGGTGQVLASALVAQGKNEEAFDEYRRMAMDEKCTFPRVLLPYSLMLLKKGQWAQALGAYDKALPHVGNAGLSGGGNQLLTEDSSFSVDDPQPADLEADIHIAMGFSNVYSSSWVPGHWHPDRDLAEYRKALDLEPNSPLANLAYAHGLLEVGRNAEATTAFRAVVSKYDGDIKRSAEEELGIYRPSAPAPASPAAK